MRILYDCFSCSPYYGSDEGLGWMWPYKMSKYHEVWVLIRKDRKEGIDRYCKENNIRGIHFVYCDLPDSVNIYYKRKAKNKNGTFDFLLYQYLWCTGDTAVPHVLCAKSQKGRESPFSA